MILVVLEDITSSKKLEEGFSKTASFRVIRMYPYNGFFYLAVEVPDKTNLREFKRCLCAGFEGIHGILLTENPETEEEAIMP